MAVIDDHTFKGKCRAIFLKGEIIDLRPREFAQIYIARVWLYIFNI